MPTSKKMTLKTKNIKISKVGKGNNSSEAKKFYFTRTQISPDNPKRSQRLNQKFQLQNPNSISKKTAKSTRRIQAKRKPFPEGTRETNFTDGDKNSNCDPTKDSRRSQEGIDSYDRQPTTNHGSIKVSFGNDVKVRTAGFLGIVHCRKELVQDVKASFRTGNKCSHGSSTRNSELKIPRNPEPKLSTNPELIIPRNPELKSSCLPNKKKKLPEVVTKVKNTDERNGLPPKASLTTTNRNLILKKRKSASFKKNQKPKLDLNTRQPSPELKSNRKRLNQTPCDDQVSKINSRAQTRETKVLGNSNSYRNSSSTDHHVTANDPKGSFRIPAYTTQKQRSFTPGHKNIQKRKIIMQVKAKPIQNGAPINNSRSMSSPEPKGTLTPPGSSPLRPDCGHPTQYTHGSAPPSPETPMTPDSAHMTAEVTNHSESFLLEGGDYSQLANREPLTGARKRKATKVHKVSTECVTRLEGDTAASQGMTCSLCQTVMTSQHDFTRHIRTHNRVIEDDSSGIKLFECGLCRKQLSSNSSLDRHMLVHSGERPFRCHICGTHFTTNGNMHRHIRGHYRNGGASSDTGDSDGGSEGGSLSPRKRRHEGEDDVPVLCKMPRLISVDEEDSSVDEEFNCQFCGVEHSDLQSLEVHLEKEHPEHPELSLKTSIQVTSSRASIPPLNIPKFSFFPTHDQGESTDRLSSPNAAQHCSTCGKSFATVEEWVIHLREHPILKCNVCNSSFGSLSDYTFHQQQHAREYELERKQSPPSIFSHGLPIRVSSQMPHFPHSDPFKMKLLSDLSPLPLSSQVSSPLAPSSHVSVSLLSSASLSHDEQFNRDYRDMKMNGQYPCRLCKEVFANLRKLKSHNLVHMISPPYQCNLCSFVSNDKNTLKEHMKNHKGDTPYECNLCSLSFTTKANCERHIKNIHGRQTRDEVKKCMTYTPQDDGPSSQETTRETVCNLCQFDCKSRSVLRDHMRSSHPEGIDKPYTCKICQVAFLSRSEAFRHAIQAHQDAVSRESLESLVEQRPHVEDPQDLSSVENMISIAQLSLPMSSSNKLTLPLSSNNKLTIPISTNNKPLIRPQSPIPLPVGLHNSTTAFASQSPIIPPTLNIPTYIPSLSSEDAPLDLSMNKRKYDDEDDDDDSEDEEITVIDDDNDGAIGEPRHNSQFEKLSNSDHEKEEIMKSSPGSPRPDSRSSSTSELVKDVKNTFPLMYQNQLPVQFYPFQSRYPFLMNPFGHMPPVPNFDHFKFLEQYQKEIKRGLHLTSGGSILSHEGHHTNRLIPSVNSSILSHASNPLLNPNASTFQLSALALAASKKEQEQLQISSPEEDIRKRVAETSPPTREAEEMAHFTMRNSVLVKKPKQRRYRTERPWRCDLCDKGFTLRSNMERHMKQQHPDLWQQKPRGASTPRSGGVGSSLSQDIMNQSADSEKLDIKSPLKSEAEESMDNAEVNKEDDENELVIDDEDEEEEEEEEEEEQEDYEDEGEDEQKKPPREESGADLASVGKLVSSASQNFSFFNKENEESEKNEEPLSSPCQSPVSQGTSAAEEGKRSAYSSAPQKQKCPFCHRKFPWSSSLVRHIRTHTGQKPYLCPVCHFPFTTKSNCDRHLQRKHPNSPHAFAGDRPYRCSKCPGAAFTSVESLRKHDMFKHEKAANDSSLLLDEVKIYALSKPFGCHLCDSRHYSTEEVLDHVAEVHPESYKLLQMEEIASPPDHTSPTRENNNEALESSPESSTPDMVRCMLCFQKYSNNSDLKSHVEAKHINHSDSEAPSASTSVSSVEEKVEVEVEGDEKDTSDFISNMLGTKPAVIDHLISSKSTTAADAAKLLGVR